MVKNFEDLIRGGEFEEALEISRQAKLEGESYLDYYNYATTLYTIHQVNRTTTLEIMDEAIENYEESIEKNPDYPYSNLRIGVLYMHKASFILAETQEGPKSRGISTEALELLKKSRAYLEKSMELDEQLGNKATEVLEELSQLEKYVKIKGKSN